METKLIKSEAEYEAALTEIDSLFEQKDLAPYFGAAGRVSDFFRGVRGLSVPTIVALHKRFHIPCDALIDETVERKPRGTVRKPRAKASRVARPRAKK